MIRRISFAYLYPEMVKAGKKRGLAYVLVLVGEAILFIIFIKQVLFVRRAYPAHLVILTLEHKKSLG